MSGIGAKSDGGCGWPNAGAEVVEDVEVPKLVVVAGFPPNEKPVASGVDVVLFVVVEKPNEKAGFSTGVAEVVPKDKPVAGAFDNHCINTTKLCFFYSIVTIDSVVLIDFAILLLSK